MAVLGCYARLHAAIVARFGIAAEMGTVTLERV